IQTPTGSQPDLPTTHGTGPNTTVDRGTKAESRDAAPHRQQRNDRHQSPTPPCSALIRAAQRSDTDPHTQAASRGATKAQEERGTMPQSHTGRVAPQAQEGAACAQASCILRRAKGSSGRSARASQRVVDCRVSDQP
ncbi:hypothetical protein T492DRAFT_988112, partial [Pavlovales sp. CCMP2436]